VAWGDYVAGSAGFIWDYFGPKWTKSLVLAGTVFALDILPSSLKLVGSAFA